MTTNNPSRALISATRSLIKKEFPGLIFKMETVSFSDLARADAVFLTSGEWGMCRGNADLFQRVKIFCEKKELDVIIQF